jgi:hypothetical protein
LAERLKALGHKVPGPTFEIGDGPLDRYIDIPPYYIGTKGLTEEQWGKCIPAHLKLVVNNYACTCYGITVEKGSDASRD